VQLTPLVLTVALVALAGCGGSKESSTTASTATPAPATTSTATTSTPTTSTPTSKSPSPSSGGASSSVSLSANTEGQLAYSTKSLSAKAGKVSIDFTNGSPISHNVTVESSSGSILGSTPTFQGGSKTLSLNLKPGTYKFFCSVPGHRQAGMEGTLVVK
jgi:plastocyanin